MVITRILLLRTAEGICKWRWLKEQQLCSGQRVTGGSRGWYEVMSYQG